MSQQEAIEMLRAIHKDVPNTIIGRALNKIILLLESEPGPTEFTKEHWKWFKGFQREDYWMPRFIECLKEIDRLTAENKDKNEEIEQLNNEMLQADTATQRLIHKTIELQNRVEPTKLQTDYTFERMQNEIDSLTAELATLKDECTCEECEKSFNDPETGVTAICIPCWNEMVAKLRAEARKKPESEEFTKDHWKWLLRNS